MQYDSVALLELIELSVNLDWGICQQLCSNKRVVHVFNESAFITNALADIVEYSEYHHL